MDYILKLPLQNELWNNRIFSVPAVSAQHNSLSWILLFLFLLPLTKLVVTTSRDKQLIRDYGDAFEVSS